MKNKLGITKGEWKQSHRIVDEDGMYSTQVYDSKGETICTLAWYPVKEGNVTRTAREDNAKLIADAGTTSNKCGKLPSELLSELKHASSALQEIRKTYVLDVNEDGEPNASVLDMLALWTTVNKLIQSIEKTD